MTNDQHDQGHGWHLEHDDVEISLGRIPVAMPVRTIPPVGGEHGAEILAERSRRQLAERVERAFVEGTPDPPRRNLLGDPVEPEISAAIDRSGRPPAALSMADVMHLAGLIAEADPYVVALVAGDRDTLDCLVGEIGLARAEDGAGWIRRPDTPFGLDVFVAEGEDAPRPGVIRQVWSDGHTTEVIIDRGAGTAYVVDLAGTGRIRPEGERTEPVARCTCRTPVRPTDSGKLSAGMIERDLSCPVHRPADELLPTVCRCGWPDGPPSMHCPLHAEAARRAREAFRIDGFSS